MSILCSVCGQFSRDLEFCDHCNADLSASGKRLPPERCPITAEGATLTSQERHTLLFPEASLVLRGADQFWRVHWISDYDWRERGLALEKRLALIVASLPAGRMLEDDGGKWLAYAIRDAGTVEWSPAPNDDWPTALAKCSADVHAVAQALSALHHHSLVWLNFDPNAIADAGATGNRRLEITNLDVEVFPIGSMPDRVRVHPHYAAPEIVQFRALDIGPRTDVYHLAAFAYYWLAGQLPDGLAGAGLERTDFALPFLRIYAPHMPEGIVAVIKRGMAFHPSDRFATPNAFAHALDESIVHANERRTYSGAVRWDVGGHTTTGRAKAELGRPNEDAILVKEDDQASLVLVADGVSTCDVGSGGLASMMTSIVIENALADGCTHDDFPQAIAEAAVRSSQGLLEWAFAHDCRADLEAGKDLMGTTLTVGWVQGRELSLANLGDSRAYLITANLVEQLTVDGDLASDLLAQGAAPEEVRELGMMARALRECVGGCIQTADGQVAILSESCDPNVSRWPLVPGDFLVLCSDGLVEEGFFLEPERVAEIVRSNKDRPAAELAQLLVDAADALQRLPTILEPDGFGDNIACVVVKITEAE